MNTAMFIARGSGMPSSRAQVPLPDIALERRLRVDLELMHVELFAEHLFHRADQARMRAQEPKGLVIGVRGEGGARCAGLFAPDFRAVRRVNPLGFLAQNRDLFLREAIGQEQIALFGKLPQLFSRQLHGNSLPRPEWSPKSSRGTCTAPRVKHRGR